MSNINFYLHVSDFVAFNTHATNLVKEKFPENDYCEEYVYTYCLEDAVEGYWAKIEHEYYAHATSEEISQMKTKEEAVSLGMIIPTIPEGEE